MSAEEHEPQSEIDITASNILPLPGTEDAAVKVGLSEIEAATVDVTEWLSDHNVVLLGFTAQRNPVFMNSTTGVITERDLLSGTSVVLNTLTSQGQTLQCEACDGEWIAWVEAEDKFIDGDSGTGKDWVLWSENLATGEIRMLDQETDYFPKTRGFYAAPDLLEIRGAKLAAHGMDADETGVYRSIILYDLNTGERTVLAREPINNGRLYSGTAFTTGFLYFGCSYFDPVDYALKSNVIFQYDLRSKELKTLDNPYDCAFSDASDRFLVAEIPWRTDKQTTEIAVFDFQTGSWIRTLDQTASFLTSVSVPTEDIWLSAPMISDSLVVFYCPIFTQHSLLYDINQNAYYLLTDPSTKRRNERAYFHRNVLMWTEITCDGDRDIESVRLTIFKR